MGSYDADLKKEESNFRQTLLQTMVDEKNENIKLTKAQEKTARWTKIMALSTLILALTTYITIVTNIENPSNLVKITKIISFIFLLLAIIILFLQIWLEWKQENHKT